MRRILQLLAVIGLIAASLAIYALLGFFLLWVALWFKG